VRECAVGTADPGAEIAFGHAHFAAPRDRIRRLAAIWPQKPSNSNGGKRAPAKLRRETGGAGENMNWDQIEGKWKQLTGSAQERWGKLTNDDIQTLTGQKDLLVGKIQERYGIAKAEAEKQADAWSRALKETRPESPATRL
jgi:uncharacterized protein YjbJ (UPF0337 family)